MDILSIKETEYTLLRVVGPITPAHSQTFSTEVGAALQNGNNVIIDLTDCEWVASHVLGIWVGASTRMASDQRLVLFGLSTKVLALLQITQVAKMVTVCKTLKAAEAAVT